MGEAIEIIDVIAKSKGVYANHPYGLLYIVVSREPKFVHKQTGRYFHAEDDGIFDCLGIQHDPYAKAFAGREFDIDLEDGNKYHCKGQVWSCWEAELFPVPAVQAGVATLEELAKCYVFSGAMISVPKLEAWLANHETHEDYYRYEKKHQSPNSGEVNSK